MTAEKILQGAVGGFVAAALIDLHAWQNDGFKFSRRKTFKWDLAIKRWLVGAVSGALIGAGINTNSMEVNQATNLVAAF